MTKCDLCGTPVKVVGHTTKHYEPVYDVDLLLEVARAAKHLMGSQSWDTHALAEERLTNALAKVEEIIK